jgi:hypothetical protein
MLVTMILALRPGKLGLLAFVFALMGGSMLPLLPISLECAIECTFPHVQEDVSSGVLLSARNVSGIIYIVAIGALLER